MRLLLIVAAEFAAAPEVASCDVSYVAASADAFAGVFTHEADDDHDDDHDDAHDDDHDSDQMTR